MSSRPSPSSTPPDDSAAFPALPARQPTASSSSSSSARKSKSKSQTKPPQDAPPAAAVAQVVDPVVLLTSPIATATASLPPPPVKKKPPPSLAPPAPPPPPAPAAPTQEDLRLTKISREWEFMHSLPQDVGELAIMVDDPKTFGAATTVMLSDLNGHIRFRITRWLPRDEAIAPQFVRRRHRDFVALALRLNHCFPELVWPSPSASTPFSSFFGSLVASTTSSSSSSSSAAVAAPASSSSSDKNEEFLQVRGRRLEAFLSSLLLCFPQACRQSPDLAAFLLKDSETFDEIATRYLNNKGQDMDIAPVTMADSLHDWVRRTSFWSTTSSAAGTTTAATSTDASALDPKTVELCSELGTAYEALNTWIDDRYVAQDRAQGVERLTNALESMIFVLAAQRDAKQRALSMLLPARGVEPSVLAALDAVHAQELDYIHELTGRSKEPPARAPGPLRSLHRLASQLGGAKEAYTRNVALLHHHHHRGGPPQREEDERRVNSVKDQFAKLRMQCGRTVLQVAQDFALLSLQKATREREQLEELKRLLLLQQTD